MTGSLNSRNASRAATSLLMLRRNLTNSDFLQTHFYTRDESKFVDSTYVYWIRLHCDHESEREPQVFPAAISGRLKEELTEQLKQRVFRRVPDVFSELVKISWAVGPECSIQECLAQREQRIRQRLPNCIPYATCFSEINRLIKRLDVHRDLQPTDEEFDALLDHLSRNSLRQARMRFPELWDETRGHYILDSRGTTFAKAFAVDLKQRGYLDHGNRFLDLGSGTGTMVAAVTRYTEANATGVERHIGVMRLAKAMMHRLQRKGCCREDRIELITGDFLTRGTLDWTRYDVLYAYSPIGCWQIDVDDVIERMRVGAILGMSQRPRRGARLVDELDPVAGLSCFRRRG